jgi:putrescine transport system substrate-binding protein
MRLDAVLKYAFLRHAFPVADSRRTARRGRLKTCGSALAAFSLSTFLNAALAAEKTVSIYGWSDAVDRSVLAEFARETGIRASYDAYESEEALEARLAAGKTEFDVALLPGPVLQRQIAAGRLARLDKTRLPHSADLWPEVEARLAAFDPGNQYAVPLAWFTTGLAYNVEAAKARLGEAAPESWDILFKPEILKKFADCGVYVLDSPADMFAIALNYLRLNPAGRTPADFKRAADLLGGVRRYVKKFSSADYVDALADGDICLAVGWSGDALHARNRAREADNGIEIDYVVPKEGATIAFDSLAILKDAPNLAEAYALIDFLLRREIAARNTNATRFANAVLGSKSLVQKDILDSKAIYPEAMNRLIAAAGADAATQKLAAREWARIKTGK